MEYPQWLLPAYIRSARAAGATASDEELTAAALRLITRWSTPERHHHGIHHLSGMLSRVTTLAPETHSPELVTLAAFYHGCVFSTADKDTYTRNGGENEVESARIADRELTSVGVPPTTAGRVAELITGMKKQPMEADSTISTTLNAIDIDKLALRDAHLGALAAGPQKYAKYLDQVAREYSHVPEEDFLSARRDILGRLLARRQIFLSPLGRQWEAAARDNLEGELERIESRLLTLADRKPAVQAEPPAAWEHPSAGRGGEERPLTPEEYADIRTSAPPSPAERIPEAEIAASSADTARIAPVGEEPIVRSSLETLPDDAQPGDLPRSVQVEQKKKAERESITRRMQERIARRQTGMSGEKPHISAPTSTPDAAKESMPTAPSAATPSLHEEDSARAGFEREPDF